MIVSNLKRHKMNFEKFMEEQGITYKDFNNPEEMDSIINQYAKEYLLMYYGV